MSIVRNKSENYIESENSEATLSRDMIVKKLKEKGFRITKQRLTLIEIILKNECSSCKEIFYKAVKEDKKIGVATVYRMINTLEEIGAINRKNMYRLSYEDETADKNGDFIVTFGDGSTKSFTYSQWKDVVDAGLSACGYLTTENGKPLNIKKLNTGKTN